MLFIFDNNQIIHKSDDGTVLAQIIFENYQKDTLKLVKVFVDPSLRGQGVAAKLMLAAYDHLKLNHLKVVPTCPYAVTWFEKNPDKQDVLSAVNELSACQL
jgi:predicted GNAT family acetyltransferase